MSFPSTPINGQTAVVSGVTYTYSAVTNAWTRSAGGITVTTANITNLNIGTSGTLTTTEVYDLDDVSYQITGFKNIFSLTYNGTPVNITNPWNLQVTLNGVQQPAFATVGDVTWQNGVLSANRGYTIDASGNLKFADVIPLGSQISIRTQVGTNSQAPKRYPFNALDILQGLN